MDLQHQYDLDKKNKKKKHHRSRSRSQHKKHKRSRSRSQRKKDKKKKQKTSYDKYRDRSNSHDSRSKERPSNLQQKQPNKQRQTQKSRQKQRNKQRSQQKNQRKKDKYDRSDYKEKQRDQKKDKYRDQKKQNQKEQKKDWNKQQKRDRQKDREDRKQKQEKRDKYERRDKQDRKQNDKQDRKQRDRQDRKQRDRQRQSKFDKSDKYAYDRYDRDKDHKRDRKQRDRQRFRSKERSFQRRSRNRSSQKRNDRYGRNQKYKDYRDDRKKSDRRSRFDGPRFRFDSPPKSDESDMSDDPQKMEKLNRMKAQKQLVTSKADRKLYLGNLPPNITSQQLMDMLNAALKKMQINTETEGDSIISAWISPDGVGHYAFVQFRNAIEATNGLTLNGASLFGYQLKLGRPKQYIEYNKQLLSQFGTDSNIDTILKKVEAIGGDIRPEITEKIICPPSKIIVIKHIVTVDQLAIDEQYEQIYNDIKDMAKRFGDVINLVIPRPHQVIDLQQVQKRVKGLGYIFIEYKTVQQAIFARKQFIQKQFSNRSVACSFFDQKRFRQAQYDICQKVIIDF